MSGRSAVGRHRFDALVFSCAGAVAVGVFLMLSTDTLVGKAAGVMLVVGAWISSTLCAVRFRTRASFSRVAKEQDLLAAQRVTRADLRQIRQESNRAASRQERALTRIEDQTKQVLGLNQTQMTPAASHRIDVLFVTSNGAGLGHISRLLAIARELSTGRKAELLTLSTAYRHAAHHGMAVHYFPSSDASGQNARVWNQHFRAHLYRLLSENRPRVVAFDGTWVYSALTDICRSQGVPLIWVQRGMWRPEVDQGSTQRHQAHRVADHVIMPGEYAGDEEVDVGDKVGLSKVGPITMTSRKDLQPRAEACHQLGLDPSSKYVLLNLGGGSLGEAGKLTRAIIEHLREVSPDLYPVVVRSPLARDLGEVDIDGCLVVEAYPVMPFICAFEYMVCAAGYNAAQEAVSLGTPAILIPNERTRTDDQLERARKLAEQQLCLVATDEHTMRQAVAELADPSRRQRLRDRLQHVPAALGAEEAARVLDSEIERASWTERAVTLRESSAVKTALYDRTEE